MTTVLALLLGWAVVWGISLEVRLMRLHERIDRLWDTLTAKEEA